MGIYKAGKNKIKEIYWGSQGISAVYKGSTKIFPDGEDYTYTYSDITFNWSSGTYLKADALNYTWITATQTKKQGTTVIEVLTGVTITPVLDTADAPYFNIDSEDKFLRFDSGYRTTDMTSQWGSGTYYTLNVYYMEDSEKKKAGTVNVEINKVVSSTTGHPQYSVEVISGNDWIPATGGTIQWHNTSYQQVTEKYTSTYSKVTKEPVAMRIASSNYKIIYANMAADGYGSYTWGNNSEAVPVLYSLRLDDTSSQTTLFRHFYIMHKCASTATTMQLSDGFNILTDGDTAVMSTSSEGWLMDNNWNGYQTYTFDLDTSGYEVELTVEGGGIFCLTNNDGDAGYAYGTITDNYGTAVYLEFEFGM